MAVSKALMAMTVADLEELKSARSNKSWLRRRLHAAILRARLRALRDQREETFGPDSDDDDL